MSVIGELAWVKAGGSEMRYFSKDLARRDSGVNYYFARPDGGLARWHRRRVIEESSYDSHEEAERVAWEKNVALAQKGKYVGRNGESWPDEADEPHDY